MPVEARGNIPAAHAACGELARNLDRLAHSLDEVAAGRDDTQLAALAAFVRSELTAQANHFANLNAHPSKVAKAARAAAQALVQPRLLGDKPRRRPLRASSSTTTTTAARPQGGE